MGIWLDDGTHVIYIYIYIFIINIYNILLYIYISSLDVGYPLHTVHVKSKKIYIYYKIIIINNNIYNILYYKYIYDTSHTHTINVYILYYYQ